MIFPNPKCVFVHIPKVAGQSVEHVFIERAGLTWDTRAPLLLRENDDPSLGPPRLAHLTAREYVECGHMTAAEWEEAFTFSFVRNPWARMVSMYKWHGLHRHISFKTFVCDKLRQKYFKEKFFFFRPQWDYISDEAGNVIVDFVGKLESINEDFPAVCQRLGWDPVPLPHKNKSSGGPLSSNYWQGVRRLPFFLAESVRHYRYEKPSYADFYDSETRDLVHRLYEKEIDYFGYSFSDLTVPR
jgi:hypothetical protein